MQFGVLGLLISVGLAPFAAALQSIYFGIISSSAGPGQCLAFFSDSDPCPDAASGFGSPYCDGNFCDEPITILGHPNITFTGCVPNDRPYPVYTQYIPTGVSDDGAPALTCKPTNNPPDAPGSEYGVYSVCPGGFVNVDAYCS